MIAGLVPLFFATISPLPGIISSTHRVVAGLRLHATRPRPVELLSQIVDPANTTDAIDQNSDCASVVVDSLFESKATVAVTSIGSIDTRIS